MPACASHLWSPGLNTSVGLRGVVWSLGLLGVSRLTWIETHVVLPLTQFQGKVAVRLVGAPAAPVETTLACSGADALAVCVGVLLSYPTAWRTRLLGAGGAVAMILGLNTLRIGTLGRAAASPFWFDALHRYVWPAVLALAILGYVFVWTRVADHHHGEPPAPSRPRLASARFLLHGALLLIAFTAAAPYVFDSPAIAVVSGMVARSAASILGVAGVPATAAANILHTSRGAFAVTPECIVTPLIPIYLAAILGSASSPRRRSLGILAAVPLFIGLGIVRLLVVALPPTLAASPVFLIHAFFQLLIAAVILCVAAARRYGVSPTALGRAMAGTALGYILMYWGASYTHAVMRAVESIGGPAIDDPQNATTFLPVFQTALYAALCVASGWPLSWKRFGAGLMVLGLLQVATLVLLRAAAGAGVTPPIASIRAWALAAPLLVTFALAHRDSPLRRRDPATPSTRALHVAVGTLDGR